MATALAQILKLTQIVDNDMTTVVNGTSSMLVTQGPRPEHATSFRRKEGLGSDPTTGQTS